MSAMGNSSILVLSAPAPNLTSAADCIDAVWRHWRYAVDSILAAGDALLRAREIVPKGEWGRFCERLPFGQSTAGRLMKIATDQRLRVLARREMLPPEWVTLHQLTTLGDDCLGRLADDGTINPGMHRSDLRRALANHRMQTYAATIFEAPLPGQYRAIVADPPWLCRTWSARGRDRSADNHYPVMNVGEIAALEPDDRPVADLAADDCALFLWFLDEMYDAAREIVRAWGFEYVKIGFVWVKTNAGGAPAPGGLGYSTREQAEFCIYARRGCPKRLDAGVQQVVMAPRGRHSEKPEEVARRVERLFPGPYLELFARTRRPGWDAWGNEAPAAVAPSGAHPRDEKGDDPCP